MKYIKLMLLSLFVFVACNKKEQTENIIACGDNKIVIINTKNKINKEKNLNIVWDWQPEDAKDLPELYKKKYFTQLDECKPVKGANKILVASSHGGVGIIDKKSKNVTFYSYVGNAHSIEMVTDSLIAVVGSFHDKGNVLALFKNNELDAKPIYTDSIYGGHGLVWENKNKLLYVLGYKDLRSYELQSNNQLKLINNWKIPGKSGHDLIQDPVDFNKLILTESENVWTFNKKDSTFSVFKPLQNKTDVKSVSITSDGKLAYTQAQEVEIWWTNQINLLYPKDSITVPNINMYKCRWDVK